MLKAILNHLISNAPTHKVFSKIRYLWFGPQLNCVGQAFFSCSGLVIDNPGNVRIGHGTSFNRNVIIDAGKAFIDIGERCLIGPNVVIIAKNHIYSDAGDTIQNQGFSHGEIVIGPDVWIGANTTITAGSQIGKGCVVGANSLVRGIIPPYTVVGGVPARTIKQR